MAKRVWTLYRVSMKDQVNKDDDIPMQKNACRKYIEQQQDWELTNELFERGVSGWKKSVDDRDELLRIKEAAVKGEFDILLVFMLDRLGRREDESPLVVDFLHKNNVEVWSVKEGKRNMEQHIDKLINYIGFWQSSGESIKTSIRVKEQVQQLAEQGYFTGGTPNFGYEIYETNIKHWKKDKMLRDTRINEYESEIVKICFDLVIDKGFGAGRIATYLNEHGYKNRNNKEFRNNTINRMLRNTIYIGRKRYNVLDDDRRIKNQSEWKMQPYREDLRIISDEDFNEVQKIIDSRSNKESQIPREIPIKSQTLLSGFVYCYHCKSKLKSDYAYKDYKRKTDGKTTRMISYRYRCNNSRNNNAHKKTQWGSKTYDKIIIEKVKTVMRQLDLNKFVDVAKSSKTNEMNAKKVLLNRMNKDKEKHIKQLAKLNEEISMALIGESDFTPKQLSNAIETTENKIVDIKNEIHDIEKDLETNYKNISDITRMASDLDNWEEKYDNADLDRKKVLLSKVVENIYLSDNEVYINFRTSVEKAIQLNN